MLTGFVQREVEDAPRGLVAGIGPGAGGGRSQLRPARQCRKAGAIDPHGDAVCDAGQFSEEERLRSTDLPAAPGPGAGARARAEGIERAAPRTEGLGRL